MGEIVDVCSGRDYKHLSEGNIPVYGTGGYMLSVNEALSYDKDAIGIGRKGTIDKPYILKAPFWTVDTLFYTIPRGNVDLNFMFDIFQNINWKKKDESTGVPSLSKAAINDIDIFVPEYIEQKALGQWFSNLDHLITLHQRKYLSFYKAGEWLVGENNPVSDYIDFVKKVLRIPQAHEMIARYTVLDKEAKKLILLRPYQIHAIEAIRAASKVGQSGFVWHTTGECVIIVTRRNRSDKQRLRAA